VFIREGRQHPQPSGAGNLVHGRTLIDTQEASVIRTGCPGSKRRDQTVSTFLWIVLGALYLTAFVMLGIATLRKGHYVLFFVGIVFPILWIVGAMMAPT
jgi:hypothetical protein